jgi:hypothetical protein
MTVALTILGAALLGGVVFMLLERWQRPSSGPAAAPEPTTTIWTPATATEPTRPIWTPDEDTRPLPSAPPPRREPPPLWTPTGHWDDDDRHRDEDDDRRPPGLWSGWADR